jgi:Cu(I)/Ag(I) efflux system membrane protein CusA/SilA
MLSSLAHVLIVTPIIFLWLRERDLRRGHQPVEQAHPAEAMQGTQNSL